MKTTKSTQSLCKMPFYCFFILSLFWSTTIHAAGPYTCSLAVSNLTNPSLEIIATQSGGATLTELAGCYGDQLSFVWSCTNGEPATTGTWQVLKYTGAVSIYSTFTGSPSGSTSSSFVFSPSSYPAMAGGGSYELVFTPTGGGAQSDIFFYVYPSVALTVVPTIPTSPTNCNTVCVAIGGWVYQDWYGVSGCSCTPAYTNNVTVNWGDGSSETVGNGTLPNICHTYTTSGTYTVSVSDATSNICTGTRSASVTVYAGTPATPTVNNATLCSGGVASLNITESGAGYQYLWSTGATTNEIEITSQTNTTQSYTVTVTASSGCTATASGTVTKSSTAAPNITLSPTSVSICAGSGTTLTSSTTSGSLDYWWYQNSLANSNYIIGSAGATSWTPYPSATTTYYLAVQSTTTLCVSAATATVTVNPLPNVSITPVNPTICAGSGEVLTTSTTSGSLYYWWYQNSISSANYIAGSAGHTSYEFYPSATTTYVVQVQNPTTLCVSSASTVVTVGCHKELLADGPLMNAFNIYPNPTTSAITIDYSSVESAVYSYRIFDILGNEVVVSTPLSKEAGDQKTNVNVSQLTAGVYICELIGEQTYRTKFVKQ